MSAIHVVVRPPREAPPSALEPLSGLFDVVVDGVNVTARVGESHALPILAELAHAVANLVSGRRRRATVQLYSDQEVWELGLEADADSVLLSVFRSGPLPEVAVYERRVPLVELRLAVQNALAEAPLSGAGRAIEGAIRGAAHALENAERVELAPIERQQVELAPRATRGIAVFARAELRKGSAGIEALSERKLERADLHSLLAAGEAGFSIRGRSAPLGNVHLFLLAERLVALADDALDAWQHGRALFRRVELGSARISVQRGVGDQPLSLGVHSPASGPERITFPELDPAALVQSFVRFARALTDSLVSADPSQARNLRITSLNTQCRALSERVEDALADDSLTNSQPESYRSFSVPPRRSETRGRWEHGGKMRFVPRWVATVPNIDLRGTFLCGDRLIVGSEREMACIHRSHGTLLWRVPVTRAASVVTPAGIARLSPDGRIALLDLDDGQVRFSLTLEPRSGGGAAGAVVHTPGLPKLLAVAEGERTVTAIDLVSGEVRWRHTLRRPGAYRVRRAGKLLLVAGDSVLVALDVASGEVVWRVRERLPFTGDLAVDHDAAFAVVSGQSGARLLKLDPWSGESCWTAEIDERPAQGQPPLLTPNRVVIPVRDRRGSGLAAFDRATGAPAWLREPGIAAPSTSWLSVDQDLVGNSASGTLLCLDGEGGDVRYSHVFPRHVDADQPRRLEPVLRSGALFVPQHQVHVVRPRDGEILGTVPTDLIPDLLRVDERCDVYVAEESGHIAGFGVAAKLTLVR
ncbi:MAG: PQQ-like beta-propeller repeat protein [Polyangiaceae bacterium]|nr:PQQ-like beta-propeller repeat protein [Polyangiaceae bacterium]MCL4751744.1 PQQ-binding-like beta-propeller repeat protein [Myxococcales bacterium]